jgi:hypothetical protein
MKTNSIRILFAATIAVTCNLQAQHTLDWFTIGGGGGTIGGGDYTLDGTVGQVDAGVLNGGSYTLEGGFWAGAEEPLRLDYARQGASVILSWRGAGIMLQQADSPAGSWQDFSPGTTSDGVNFQLTVPMTAAKRFYRLRR